MVELNPFLSAVESLTKGGGQFIEDPCAVENIVFQTRGAPLDAFELGLADALMGAYDDGAEELEDVVASLNGQRFPDRLGDDWTGETLKTELADASTLFAPTGGA